MPRNTFSQLTMNTGLKIDDLEEGTIFMVEHSSVPLIKTKLGGFFLSDGSGPAGGIYVKNVISEKFTIYPGADK